MRILLLIFILQLLVPGQVIDRSPYLTNQDVNDIYFLDENTGWAACSGGILLATYDGGDSWERKNTGFTDSIFKILAPDFNTLYLLTGSYRESRFQKIYRSTDGGTSFVPLNIPPDEFYDCSFVSPETGYLSGVGLSLYKTIDYGNTWTVLLNNGSTGYTKLSFIDENRGWLTTTDGDIYKTPDGGTTWEHFPPPHFEFYGIRMIHFISPDTGYAVKYEAEGGYVLFKSSDGGINWENSGGAVDLMDIQWLGSSHIYITAGFTMYSNYGPPKILYSSDAGDTWQSYLIEQRLQLTSICFITPEKGITGGIYGYLASVNSSFQFSPLDGDFLWGIAPLNDSAAVACGEGGTILKTEDNGRTWRRISSGVAGTLRDALFVDSLNGYLFGDHAFLASSDAGETWTHHIYPAFAQFYTAAVNSTVVIGAEGYLYISTDGGLTWNNRTPVPDKCLSISFVNENSGWVLYNNDLIYMTTDGGLTWKSTPAPPYVRFLEFYDDSLGLTAGVDLYKTTNGGSSWNRVSQFLLDWEITDLAFADTNRVYYWSGNHNSYIYRDQLTKVTRDLGKEVIGEMITASLASLNFERGKGGWGVYWKTILRIDSDDIVSTNNDASAENNPEGYYLSQNYPNPFNPSTAIEFSIPENGKVSLKIYDALGREVKTLLNESVYKGIHKINFEADGLPSGVYYLRLQADGFNAARKMLLLK